MCLWGGFVRRDCVWGRWFGIFVFVLVNFFFYFSLNNINHCVSKKELRSKSCDFFPTQDVQMRLFRATVSRAMRVIKERKRTVDGGCVTRGDERKTEISARFLHLLPLLLINPVFFFKKRRCEGRLKLALI